MFLRTVRQKRKTYHPMAASSEFIRPMDCMLWGPDSVRAAEERAARAIAEGEHYTAPLLELLLQNKQELISIAHSLGVSLEGIYGAGDVAGTASPGGEVAARPNPNGQETKLWHEIVQAKIDGAPDEQIEQMAMGLLDFYGRGPPSAGVGGDGQPGALAAAMGQQSGGMDVENSQGALISGVSTLNLDDILINRVIVLRGMLLCRIGRSRGGGTALCNPSQ